jgi:Amt family ammonium transporter
VCSSDLGWNGFNGGDPYFANPDASAAVLNTNICAGVAMLTWMFIDVFATGKPQLLGAVNGMITGLVAITPAAGYVNGYGAIALGIVASAVPWFTMNKLAPNVGIFKRVDDALGVIHTHGFAGLIGGLGVGVLADSNMIVYYGTGKTADVSVTGSPHQLLIQLGAAATIIVWDGILTFVILKLICLVVPLRLPEAILEIGDLAIHGEVVSGDFEALAGRVGSYEYPGGLSGTPVGAGTVMASSLHGTPPPISTR